MSGAPPCRTLVLVNELAGAGAMADVFRRAEHPLRDAIGAFDVAFTDYVGHATKLVREALADGYRRVVVGGGDGTLNEVVNGWFGADGAPIAPDARIALLTGGTGGDFRKTLGVTSREHALAAIIGDRAVPHDVGRVRFRTDAGTEGTRYFVNIASFGLSGLVDRHIPGYRQLGGKLAYVGATLRSMWGWRNPRVRVVLDGAREVSQPIVTVAVANGRYFGGGMEVAPRANPTDGQFHVTILGDLSRVELLMLTQKIYDGRHVEHPKVSTFVASSVFAESADRAVYLDVDGEALGGLPAQIDMLPGALRIVVP